MKATPSPWSADANGEISELIATLLATERRLVELTAGEVDAVAGNDGRTFLLRRAQEQLRQRETEKQAAILDSLSAHVALLDSRGTIVAVNRAWAGFPKHDLIHCPGHSVGVNYLELCALARGDGSPDSLEVAAGIRSILSGEKKIFSIEYACDLPSEQRWFLLTITPLTGDPPTGAVVMHLNISGTRQAELAQKALALSTARRERLLTTALSSLKDFAYCFDREGRFTFANQPLLDLWGLTLDEVVGKNFLDLGYPAELAERSRRQVQEVFATKVSVSGETEYTSRLGISGYYEYIFSPAFAENGSVDFVVGSTRDIGDRKRAEDALRASQKLFTALFEQAAVGVALVDPSNGRFKQVNLRYCQIAGRTRYEMEQMTYAAITHPDDLGRDIEMMNQLKNGKLHEFTREKRYVRKDGSEVWVNLTVSAMGTEGEAADYHIVFVQDVSERKRLEEQSRQGQKMDAIGTLAGGIAHDFNNILGAINGYTELAQMTLRGNPEVREHLGAVLLASRRAADLVRQILTFSRQQSQARLTIQLRPVVAECLELLRATLPTTIVFEVSLATDAPTVLADPSQIHQVLMNLGINAWHATKEGSGVLQVRLEKYIVDETHAAARPELHPGLYARISVIDSGCGMDAATLQRIFEPFFTTKPAGGGTGLGLSVVHGIMDSHDGAVTVYSQPGEGTVFHLYFPAHLGVVGVTEGDPGPVPKGNGERILLVDDEALLVQLGEKALGKLGYKVEVTTEPAIALSLVRSDPLHFDLVLTDQTMPGMTGLLLASQLREIRPHLPVILMSGYGLSLTPERVEAAGVCQLLLKPITLQSMAKAVHAALRSPTALLKVLP